jgi:urea transport system substrate-binding protein
MPESNPSDPTIPGQPLATTAVFPFLTPPDTPDHLGRLAAYRVVRLIGSGGMGLVFLAEDTTLRREVALKVLKPELAADPANRERFLREARASAALTSDYVVTVYQVGESNGVPFLAMQYLRGESLQERIERPTAIGMHTALQIARHTALGLADAHARGMVHRDIKPANVWLESDGEGGPFRRVKLLDFGLARLTHGETALTATGFIVGTPNFMAPEHASGEVATPSSDLFSLGCVMYTLFTREMPFKGNTVMAVMMALATKVPDSVQVRNSAVPPAVAGLVARLMRKDPNERPRSASGVAVELEHAIAELPPSPVSADITQTLPASRSPETLRVAANDTTPGGPTQALPTPPPLKSGRGVWLALGVAAVFGVAFFLFRPKAPPVGNTEPVVVGVLHSQSGTMETSERPVVDATLLAIEEVNAAGGVLGRPIKVLEADGESDPTVFARKAEKLLGEDNASAVFGCWTSASRKAVRDVFQRRRGLLFYPVQYEGLEQSPAIVYTGPAPNQQLIPAVEFLTGPLAKKRLFLVGSDYVFPRTAHEIIKDQLKKKSDVVLAGEAFLPLGSPNADEVAAAIVKAKPDAIINTINGSTNFHFFRALRAAGVTATATPTLSVSITENELQGLNPAAMAGDYLAASYFQSVDTPASRAFVTKLRAKYGPNRVASDMMASAYSGVHLWAKAVAAAGSVDAEKVSAAIGGQEFDGPGGRVKIDPENRHAWLPVRIGKVRADGQLDLVPGAGSEASVRPIPYPDTRSPVEWEQFLTGLNFQWGGRWVAPQK